jgi:hypothetical protein
MDGIFLLLAVAGGAVLAGILAFIVLSAIASLVEVLPPRLASRGEAGDCDGWAAVSRAGERLGGPAGARLRGAHRTL